MNSREALELISRCIAEMHDCFNAYEQVIILDCFNVVDAASKGDDISGALDTLRLSLQERDDAARRYNPEIDIEFDGMAVRWEDLDHSHDDEAVEHE